MKSHTAPSLGFQLTLAARLYRTRLARALGDIDLFPGQEQVLRALGTAPDGLRMGDLARALHVRPPTLTKTIQRLQSQDLIERTNLREDGRVVHLRLTQAGEAKLALVSTLEAELEAELSSLFKAKAEARLRKSLKRLARHLAPASDTAQMGQNDTAEDDTAEDDTE